MSAYGESQKHINQLATEAVSRGAGRPEIDSEAIFNELISKPETRKQLITQLNFLVDERKKVVHKQDMYKDHVKAVKETTGLASSFITQAVDAVVKDSVDKKKTQATQFADLMQLLLEEAEKTESDEDFGE